MDQETFYSGANRVLGVIGMAFGVIALVGTLANESGRDEYAALALLVLLTTLTWAFLVRPRIWLTATTLTLHNPLTTIVVPIHLVTGIDVRRYTVVQLADETVTSTAMSRGIREIARHDRGVESPQEPAAYMTGRILARVDASRTAGAAEDAAVRRTLALPEIVVLGISAVAFIVAVLV